MNTFSDNDRKPPFSGILWPLEDQNWDYLTSIIREQFQYKYPVLIPCLIGIGIPLIKILSCEFPYLERQYLCWNGRLIIILIRFNFTMKPPLASSYTNIVVFKCEETVFRDHFLYDPSQWETMLQCNIISHWLSACTEWSLCLPPIISK